MFLFKNKKKEMERGFSLMELLVVIALLIIILSVSLFSYDNFGKDVELENSAYSVALTTRETQVYGINKALKGVLINEVDTSSIEESFGGDYGYGIYFEKDAEDNSTEGTVRDASKKEIIVFLDKPEGSVFDQKFDKNNCGDPDNECFRKIVLGKGNYIYDLEYKNGPNWISVGSLEFYFKRPDPEAKIINNSGDIDRERGRVSITDPSGSYRRCVIIGNLGDITISRDCPDF